MPSSSRSETTTTSNSTSSPLDDRLQSLTQSLSDEELPQIRGVHLIRDGPDAGLYQICVPSHDGGPISLGCSNGIEKASEIYDMVALGLHGRAALLNFSPRRYGIETYLNVLLTFQKLFPANLFWHAVKRGIEAGVEVDGQNLRTNPILSTFFSFAAARPKTVPDLRWTPRPVARWPPFCPPWMLQSSKTESASLPPVDATAMVGSVLAEESSEPFEQRRQLKKRRAYHVPRNGVVLHRAMHPFVPPSLVLRCHDESDASRRTRRGRSVKQPVRYREETQVYFSDSDSLDGRSTARAAAASPEISAVLMSSENLNGSVPVVKTLSSQRAEARRPEQRISDPCVLPLVHPPPLQCYTPLRRKTQRLC